MPELERIGKEIDETSKKVSGKLVQIAGAIFGIWSIIWIAVSQLLPCALFPVKVDDRPTESLRVMQCIIYSAQRLRQSIEICIDSLPAEERLAKARQNLSHQLLRNPGNSASNGRINKSEISINMILEEMMEEEEGPLRSTLTSSSSPAVDGPIHIEHSSPNSKNSNESQSTIKSSKIRSLSSFPSLLPTASLSKSSLPLPENSDRPFALILERNETTLYPRDFQVVLDGNVNSQEKARVRLIEPSHVEEIGLTMLDNSFSAFEDSSEQMHTSLLYSFLVYC